LPSLFYFVSVVFLANVDARSPRAEHGCRLSGPRCFRDGAASPPQPLHLGRRPSKSQTVCLQHHGVGQPKRFTARFHNPVKNSNRLRSSANSNSAGVRESRPPRRCRSTSSDSTTLAPGVQPFLSFAVRHISRLRRCRHKPGYGCSHHRVCPRHEQFAVHS